MNKLELIAVTVRIPKFLKQDAEDVTERHGDFSRMVAEGLEIVVAKRRQEKTIKAQEQKAS
jgi:hypothetical protein